jgi:hypothetical protein
MVRFIESIKFNPAFAKAIYNICYDPDKEDIYLNKCSGFARKLKGWPDGLNTENFEVVSVGSESITFVSGGDWQEMVPVKLQLIRDTTKLEWFPFDSYTRQSDIEIKSACKDLIKCVEGQMNEDCQIAGPMMGDIPQNMGSTLSLGYKSGRILPLPKKVANSKDYNSIPHF